MVTGGSGVHRRPSWPFELLIAPIGTVPDLADVGCDRDGLAAVLVDALARLDQIFDAPMPYMMWIHQRPTDGGVWPGARVHLHVAPQFRTAGTPRFVAAAEVGGGVFFNPVSPRDAARPPPGSARARRDDPGAGRGARTA